MDQNTLLAEEKMELMSEFSSFNNAETRALRSIENEAEIKVRLSRYENYVKDLKKSIGAFKRLEIEKFNIVLEHNYKEHQKLQKEHEQALTDLKASHSRIRDLEETV